MLDKIISYFIGFLSSKISQMKSRLSFKFKCICYYILKNDFWYNQKPNQDSLLKNQIYLNRL